MSGNGWQDVFCGREKELQFLKDKWDLIASSEKPEPQCIALIAESGFGKTRLVQEFYSWLVEKEDREGYWPKKLGSEVENLRVNPDFSKADKRPTMPFLWWGVRFNGSQDRNQHVGSSLPTYIPHLVPHFYELHAARERASVILNGGGLLINLATLGSIQLVQSISELGNLGFSAAVLARDKYLSKKDKTNKGSVKNIQNSHLRDQVDILYQDFRSMMTPSMDGGIAFQDVLKVIKGKTNLESVMATMKPVPTVIFLDDAQWIDEDALSLISKLMEDAKSNSWPLMIIATHRESEWKKKEVELDSGSKFVSFARSCSANLTFLNKTYGLETMLKSAFPNLTCKQRKIIVDRTDGNPGYMEAIIRDLKDEPEYFVEEDFNKPLTNEGEEYIQRQECDFFNITEKRFKKLPLELRKALRWATYQGVTFSEELSRSMYYEMIEGSDDTVDFDMAESPFCFISREKPPISEFRQQLFFEVANKRLKSKSEELERLRKAIKNAILSWMNSNDVAKANDSELKLIIGLAKLHFDKRNKVDNENLLRLLNESKEYYTASHQLRTVNEVEKIISSYDNVDVFEDDWAYEKRQTEGEYFTNGEHFSMEVDCDELEMHDAMIDAEVASVLYNPIQELHELECEEGIEEKGLFPEADDPDYEYLRDTYFSEEYEVERYQAFLNERGESIERLLLMSNLELSFYRAGLEALGIVGDGYKIDIENDMEACKKRLASICGKMNKQQTKEISYNEWFKLLECDGLKRFFEAEPAYDEYSYYLNSLGERSEAGNSEIAPSDHNCPF